MQAKHAKAILKVLIEADRADLAKALVRVPPEDVLKVDEKGETEPAKAEAAAYGEHLKAMLITMGRTMGDVGQLSEAEWKVIEDAWLGKKKESKV